MIKAQKGVLSVMREYSSMFHIVTMLIVAVTVLVLVLAQFRRYGRELGLLAAFGVSMGELCAHLFAKAVIIGIIGGLAGFFPGLFLAGLSGKFLGVASAAGFEQLAPVLGMSLFSSIIGALIPVYVVFNIDPVETLREA
jgi:putative ABC transport system permease protein